MKFKNIAIPKPSKGLVITQKKQVLPNASISLAEMLQRFTRNEALPVGHEVQYHESEDDISKVKHMDLTEKEEFIEKQKQTKDAYEKQEKAKAKRERERLEKEERAKIRADIEAENKGKGAPPAKAD